jgi:hypothetical protein
MNNFEDYLLNTNKVGATADELIIHQKRIWGIL